MAAAGGGVVMLAGQTLTDCALAVTGLVLTV